MAIKTPIAAQKMLLELGLVPLGCTNIELIIPASGAMVFRYDVYVTADQLEQLIPVFQVMASEAKAIQDQPDPRDGEAR